MPVLLPSGPARHQHGDHAAHRDLAAGLHGQHRRGGCRKLSLPARCGRRPSWASRCRTTRTGSPASAAALTFTVRTAGVLAAVTGWVAVGCGAAAGVLPMLLSTSQPLAATSTASAAASGRPHRGQRRRGPGGQGPSWPGSGGQAAAGSGAQAAAERPPRGRVVGRRPGRDGGGGGLAAGSSTAPAAGCATGGWATGDCATGTGRAASVAARLSRSASRSRAARVATWLALAGRAAGSRAVRSAISAASSVPPGWLRQRGGRPGTSWSR